MFVPHTGQSKAQRNTCFRCTALASVHAIVTTFKIFSGHNSVRLCTPLCLVPQAAHRGPLGSGESYAFSLTTDSDTETLVTPEDTEAVSSVAGAQARLGNLFCSATLYLGWLMPYTMGL